MYVGGVGVFATGHRRSPATPQADLAVDAVLTASLESGKQQTVAKRRELRRRIGRLYARLDDLFAASGMGEFAPPAYSPREPVDRCESVEEEADGGGWSGLRVAGVDSGAVRVAWDAPQGGRVVVVVRPEGDDGEWAEAAVLGPAATEVSLGAGVLRAGVVYRLKCRSGDGPWRVLKGLQLPAPAPGAPSDLRSVEASHSACILQWEPVAPEAAAFELQCRGSGDAAWSTASSRISKPACRKLHLRPSADYQFRVRGVAPGGAVGPWSAVLALSTLSLDRSLAQLVARARLDLEQKHGLQPLRSDLQDQRCMWPPSLAAAPGSELLVPRGGTPSSQLGLGVLLRRQMLVEDSFQALADLPAKSWVRTFALRFQGEEGADYGALTRDWLVQLLERLANPELGLFALVTGAAVTHPSPTSVVQPDHLRYFRMFGLALAKAFLSRLPVTVRLSSVLLKRLLKRKGGALADLQRFDPELHTQLRWMLDHPIDGVLDQTFTITKQVLGKVVEVELVPNGAEIEVTDANKAQYVERHAAATMEAEISEQISAVCDGFHELVPVALLDQLSVADLHVALSGLPHISTHEWRRNTDLLPGFASHPQSARITAMFWEIVGELTPELRSKLLYFATASASPPPGGFAKLAPHRFNLDTDPDLPPGALPGAHSCFNTLVLPLDIADDYETFRSKLITAISECDSFALL